MNMKRDIICCVEFIIILILTICSVIVEGDIIVYCALSTLLIVFIIYVCDLAFIKFSNWLDK